jgi:hypothetical protein
MEGDQAKPATIYVQVPRRSGLKRELQAIFPGARTADGKLNAQERIIDGLLKLRTGVTPVPDFYRAAEVSQPEFARLIKKPSGHLEEPVFEGWTEAPMWAE